VFVSDEDSIEAINFPTDGGQARQSFAFSEAGVNQDAGTIGFEQRQVARTTGRKNGNAQTD
jgi:hypothetical protein